MSESQGRPAEGTAPPLDERPRPLLLGVEALAYVAASICDAVLTVLLLWSTSDGDAKFRVGERNPIAAFVLNHWGLRGMVYFKLLMVGFVLAIAQAIAIKKPALGRWVLRFGAIVVGCVVVYSAILYSLAH